MPPDPKEIQDDSLDRQESLGLSDGLEPSHLSLPLSGWLVRDFSTIVSVSGCVVKGRCCTSQEDVYLSVAILRSMSWMCSARVMM